MANEIFMEKKKLFTGKLNPEQRSGVRRGIQMLRDLANDGGYVAVKRAAEDRGGWRKDVKHLLHTEDY